ncbi:MAG: hypothetical protein AAGD07_07305 [Planctomycetota bacterium]
MRVREMNADVRVNGDSRQHDGLELRGTKMASRRDFLCAISGGGWSLAQSPLSKADARLPSVGIRMDAETKRLVQLIDETPREECPALLVTELKRGVPYRELLAAAFLFAALRDGHHSVYLVHSAHQLSLDSEPNDRMLPLFWAVDVMKEHLTRFRKSEVKPMRGPLPSAQEADAEFETAMKAMDREKAEHAIIAICRTQGPKQAYTRFLPYAARDNFFIGHIPIGIVSAGRALNTIGWHHAEPTLRYIVRDMYRHEHTLQGQPYPHNVERTDKTHDRLPVDWASHVADKERTIELLSLMKRGRWWISNDWVAENLIAGNIKAGTVWDAIHLMAAELMLFVEKGGQMGTRALHSNTAANALHHVFATSLDSRTRYLTMLQALSWVTEFMLGVRDRDGLLPGHVGTMQAAELTGGSLETIEAMLSALPPRSFLHRDDDRAGQLKAAELTFALTQTRAGANAFIQAAQHAMARRLSRNAHEMKYPIAMFEESRRISPAWRPHLLAATSVYLQGTNSPNNPAVERGARLLVGA